MQRREPIIHRSVVYKTRFSLYQSFYRLQIPDLSGAKQAILLGRSAAQALTHLRSLGPLSLSCASAGGGRTIEGSGEMALSL